jgi:DNA mismatch repair ATPase MutS
MAFMDTSSSTDRTHTNDADEGLDFLPRVTFLHTVRRGVQHESYGLNVAVLANIPMEVIKRAWRYSRRLQEQTRQRQQIAHFRLLYETLDKLNSPSAESDDFVKLRAKMLELAQSLK